MNQINDRELENLLTHVISCKPGFDDILNQISDRLVRDAKKVDLLEWYLVNKPDVEYPVSIYSREAFDLFYDKVQQLKMEQWELEMKTTTPDVEK